MSININISANIAGIELENPVLLASGTAGYGDELEPYLDISALGGLVLKSVTSEPRLGNIEPRIWETTGGLLNSIGLENMGIDSFVEDVLPGLDRFGIPIIASVAGDTVREYARMATRIEGTGVAAAIEVNVSCPNVEKGGIQFGVDAGATSAVVMAIRENCDLPIFVKLSAAVSDIAAVASSAEKAGASGLSLINTLPGLAINPISRRPRLGGVTGGLSGPAIKPVALKAVWDCRRATGLPIIGGGGIYDADDVIEFLIAGASAVALGSVLFQDLTRPLEIIEDLPRAIERTGARSISELVGTLRVEGGREDEGGE